MNKELNVNVKDVLSVGMEVKNYKAMCELLQENVKEGNSKKPQISNWERYFEYKKSGQKFIITHIYDEPLDEEFNHSRAIYVKHIESILLDKLSKTDGFAIHMTKNQIYKMLGMVSDKYKKVSNGQAIKESKLNMDNSDVEQFNTRASGRLNEILESSIKSLERRSIIIHTTKFVINYTDIDDNDDEVKLSRISTDDEDSDILGIIYSSLKDMKLKHEGDAFIRGKLKELYNLVNERVFDEFGWDSIYKIEKIIYSKDSAIISIPFVEIEKEKLILNNKVANAIDEQAKRKYENYLIEANKIEEEISEYTSLQIRYEDACKRCANGDMSTEDFFKIKKPVMPKYMQDYKILDEDYIDIQKELCKMLIRY